MCVFRPASASTRQIREIVVDSPLIQSNIVDAMPKEPINIDSDWFYKRIDAADMSLREVARKIDMDPTALSRTLRGQRRLQMGEVERLADVLSVTLDDVLSHAGVPIGQDRSAPPASEVINGEGQLDALSPPRTLPTGPQGEVASIIRARGVEKATVALVDAREGPLSPYDQALLVYGGESSGRDGTLCVVALSDGRRIVARFERVTRFGDATLRTLDGAEMTDQIVSAQPVLAILP